MLCCGTKESPYILILLYTKLAARHKYAFFFCFSVFTYMAQQLEYITAATLYFVS